MIAWIGALASWAIFGGVVLADRRRRSYRALEPRQMKYGAVTLLVMNRTDFWYPRRMCADVEFGINGRPRRTRCSVSVEELTEIVRTTDFLTKHAHDIEEGA